VPRVAESPAGDAHGAIHGALNGASALADSAHTAPVGGASGEW
jgi:hypothetical protein